MALPKWIKIKYEDLSLQQKQFIVMNALNAASRVLEGSNVTKEQLTEYSDFLIERYFIFEDLKKPSYDMPKKEEKKKNKKEPF